MPKYIVHGVFHLKYQISIIADDSIKAKEKIQEYSAADLEFYNEGSSQSVNEVNPTVEAIQGE